MADKIIENCAGFIVYKLDDDGQKYLLLHQVETNTWSFPKGHIEPGETELQAAVRELYEETGLVADPVCGFRRETTYQSSENLYKHLTLFLTEYDGDEILLSEDITHYEWVDAGVVAERLASRNILPAISAADHYAVSVFLRDLLNSVPCTSGNEFTMKEFLMAFLGNCGDALVLQDMDNWFYAVHYEDDTLPWVAVRADIDAILDSEGHPFHGCGHDGHSAIVACLAVLQSTLTLNKNIVYIFQPEEETGAGAEKCLPILQKYGVSEIYGFHNIPGYKAGELLVRRGTFACSSFGLILRFIGRQSHAASPETALNPCFHAAGFLNFWDSFFQKDYRGVVKGTVVGLNSNTVKFGISPAVCDVAMTLRGEYEEDLDALENAIYEVANNIADAYGLDVQNLYSDIFPLTANDDALAEKAEGIFAAMGGMTVLDDPMLWAEDFGRYSEVCQSYYFGIGAGEDAAELHSDDYEWNDLINWRIIEALQKLTEQ